MSLTLMGLIGFLVAGCHPLSRPSLAPYRQMMARPAHPQPGLTVRFLGTSSLVFDDGDNAVMIDGFLTRPSPDTLLLGRLRPDRDRVDFALGRARIRGRLAAIFVAHSHFDHAMDAPFLATQTGALLVGSRSMAYIAQGAGLPADQVHVLRRREVVEIGRFAVTAFRTPHSPNSHFAGPMRGPLRQPARMAEYRGGANYSFLVEHGRHRILVVPSANYSAGAFEHVPADVIFLSIGTLGRQSAAFAANYWRETVLASGAQLVIPIHWDDFTRPLNQPLVPMRRGMDDFEQGMALILALAQRDAVTVRLPEAFTAIDLDQR